MALLWVKVSSFIRYSNPTLLRRLEYLQTCASTNMQVTFKTLGSQNLGFTKESLKFTLATLRLA